MKFKEYPFSELLSNIVDNRGKTCPIQDVGIPLIATNCIKNESLYPVFEKVRYISSETYNNWFRGHPKQGDLIFVCKGSPGRVAWVPDPVTFCIAQDMVAIRADDSKIDPKYLFALLRSKAVQDKIVNMHVGTLIPHFKKGDFKNLHLSIHTDIEYQKKIGVIYFDISKKIESNTKANQTLEQIAQAIFKSWFVDFDPVKAKIAVLEAGGTQEAAELAAMSVISGKDAEQLAQLKIQDADAHQQLVHTAALFPAAMQESELGEIPDGWRIGSIGEIAKAKGGFAFKSNDFTTEGNEVVKIKNITGDGRVDLDDCDYINDEVANKNYKFKLSDGDLLMAMTGATVGKVGVVATSGKSAYVNQRVAKFESDKFGKKISWFLYPCIQRQIVFDSIVGAAQGSAQPNISSSGIESTEIVLPTSALINHYCDKLDPYFTKWISHNMESRLLAQLRDAVLPKLLSGEISLLDEELI